MISYINMRWRVKAETIWVFSLLIEMMSCASYMKSLTFKKIFLKTVNKKLDKRKRKLE